MKSAPDENLSIFEDSIELNYSMTPQLAIEKLAVFHNATPEDLLKAFINLKGFEQGTIEFSRSVNNSTPCIVMEGKHADGKFAWRHYINKSTGNPMAAVG